MKIKQWFFNKWYQKHPPEIVKYWMTKGAVEAKVTTDKDGRYIMQMEGEKYPFPGFPRGSILFKTVSKLKHEIKNQLFNASWYSLEDGKSEEEVIRDIKNTLRVIKGMMDERKYYLLPPNRMCPAVAELWRAWTSVEGRFTGEKREICRSIKETMCFILQEDDAYRFRVQWIMKFFKWGVRNVSRLDFSLSMLEHAEVVGDMRERIRLLRRILMLILKDNEIKGAYEALFKEIDIKKLRLSKADKYFFRGKYFRVDYPEYSY